MQALRSGSAGAEQATRASAYGFARQNRVEEAVATLGQTMKLDPSLQLTPETEVAVERDPEIEASRASDMARANNSICSRGSLDGR